MGTCTTQIYLKCWKLHYMMVMESIHTNTVRVLKAEVWFCGFSASKFLIDFFKISLNSGMNLRG